jgi:hypothetical protein
MTADPDFQPIFGPNGAVLNAPSMTPEMRAKIEEARNIPPRAEVLRGIQFLVLIFAVLYVLFAFAEPLKQFLLASPTWAMAVTAALVMLALVCLWRFSVDLMRRWEFLGARRTLRMPAWSRVTLLITDLLMGYAVAVVQINTLTDFAGERAVVSVAALGVIFLAAMVGWMMRALADELKWTWRSPA